MSVYTSKFTGEEIDAALDKILAFEERLTALESKEDKDTVYDDTELSGRVEFLEGKEDKDTLYDDSSLIARIEALEAKLAESDPEVTNPDENQEEASELDSENTTPEDSGEN